MSCSFARTPTPPPARSPRPLLLGQAPDNDVVLQGEGIRPHHAMVWVQLRQPIVREPYPYQPAVSSPERFSARAVLLNLDSGESCALTGGNAVAALYVLGRRLRADRERGLSADEAGWCSNEDLARGVWGHEWRARIENHLHVLVHRLRAKIARAELDARCVETRHGAARLFLREVALR